jgi:hypothetical protein
MKVKFINRDGKEQVVDSLAEFISAVRDGELSSDTLVFDEHGQRWKKATEIVEFPAVVSDIQMTAPIADTSQASSEGAGDVGPPATPAVVPNSAHGTGWRTPVWKWVFSAPTLYAITIGLGYTLVESIAPLVRDEFLSLAVTLTGAAGAIMGVCGLFRRRKTTARWERVIAAAVVLSTLASLGSIAIRNRRAGAIAHLTHLRLQPLMQTFDAQVKAIGLPDVFKMLGGQEEFDISKIVGTRGQMDDLVASLDKTKASAEGYLREWRGELSPVDPNSLVVEHLSQTLTEGLAVKREYFGELERFLDFLISKSGTYRVTSQGLRFQTQKDADIYNTSMDRIMKYENRLTAFASDLKNEVTAKVVPSNALIPRDEMLEAFIGAKLYFSHLHPDYDDSLMGAYNLDSVTKVGAGQYHVVLKYDSKPIQCEVDQSGARCSP